MLGSATLGHRGPPRWNYRKASFRSTGRPARWTALRCSSGPQEPRDEPSKFEPSGDQPKRAQHPELEESGSTGTSTSSSIPDALPYLGEQTDWREFRAKLVSQSRGGQAGSSGSGAAPDSGEWAHVVSGPEKGCLLLAHPLLFQTKQTHFHRAAILLLEHGEKGSYGVILNRPSKYLLGDVPLSRPQQQFASCRLYVGGDVGLGEVQVVHPHGELAGALEVVKGVYVGGMDAARAAVDGGSASPKEFRWFSAYAGWAPGQLAMECKRGVWFTAAASPGLLLQEVELGEGAAYWHRVMRLLGGQHEELSKVLEAHEEPVDNSEAD